MGAYTRSMRVSRMREGVENDAEATLNTHAV